MASIPLPFSAGSVPTFGCGAPLEGEMFQPSYRVLLGMLAAILVAATGLWSLLTY
jgi:hypothetical protein